jgi:two-component system nitrate/nitrite response regulator NarL
MTFKGLRHRRKQKGQPMSIDRSFQEQTFSMIDKRLCVTKVYICASALLRVGLEQILDGTCFAVSKDAIQDISDLPSISDTAPVLFLIDERYRPNGAAELVCELKGRDPAARVVVLADQFDFGAVMAARHAGADGFCLTTADHNVLIRSLELVMLGEIIVPSELILAIMGDSSREAEFSYGRGTRNMEGVAPQSRRLSSRETEILCWLKEGAPNKVIARKLNLTEATVKVHVKAILRKIGVGNRTQAAIWAADHLPSESALQ